MPREQLVIQIHGIFDRGNWTAVRDTLNGPHREVRRAPYKLAGLIQLWFPPFRENATKFVERQLTQYRTQRPHAEITVIAHSFGTYHVARALQRSGIKIHRLIFCGSILPLEFPFHTIAPHVTAQRYPIINECGSKDIWPPLAQAYTWGFGDTGTQGAGSAFVWDRFHIGRHSLFSNPEFVREYWLPLLDADPEPPPQPPPPAQEAGFVVAGSEPAPARWLMFLVWLPIKWIIAAALVVLMITTAMVSYRYIDTTQHAWPVGNQFTLDFAASPTQKLIQLEGSSDEREKAYARVISPLLDRFDGLSKDLGTSQEGNPISGVYWGEVTTNVRKSACHVTIPFNPAIDEAGSEVYAFLLSNESPSQHPVIVPLAINIVKPTYAKLHLKEMRPQDKLLVLLFLKANSRKDSHGRNPTQYSSLPAKGGIKCKVCL